MVLKVHHLGISQSERIIFLCEELSIPYELVLHKRAPMLAPDSLKSIPGNLTGKAPFIEDTSTTGKNTITLSESGAIAEYIINVHGNGKLAVPPSSPNYADYLFWFHWSNATLQPQMSASMFPAGDEQTAKFREARLHAALRAMEERLKESKWLAGEEFTAADVMPVWTLTTQRYWGPLLDLSKYPSIVRWLRDIGERPAYQRAMEKGDPEMRLLLGAEPPAKSIMGDGGIESSIWKKDTKNSNRL